MLPRTISKLSDETTKSVTKLDQDFDLGESLGKGGYGEIVKAKRKCDDNEFAIKIIKFDSNMEDVDTIRREAKMLAKLSHNNIVRYFNSWMETAQVTLSEYEKMKSDSDESLSSEFQKLSQNGCIEDKNEDEDHLRDDYEEACTDDDENENDDDDGEDDQDSEEKDDDNESIVFRSEYKQLKYLFIQMELCEKRNLRTAIDNNLYLEESKLNKYFKEICEGLSCIHKNNIVHRDLKPENIFVTSDDVIKIGDFGLSKQISLENEFEALQNGEVPYGSLTAVCGTSVYIAPELYSGNKFNVKADIYSLGVTYFEMCSRPMTGMEKQTVFPIAFQAWKTINFSTNNYKKKFIVRNLLHTNHHERPTCEEILKILNSDKSIDEIKEVIQQSRRVPNQQVRAFEKGLKSTRAQKTELTAFFLKTAVKIFELHGGQNIPLPTFIPSFSHHSDNLTTLLNTRGNSTAISNTSRIAFSYYVATNKIRKIRRYSIGKNFEEGYFSPTEVQECLFEAVSPGSDDYVTDAEMLYIAKEVCVKTFPNDKSKIYLIINHGHIFSTVLKYCRISKKDASVITNIMMNSNIIATTQAISGLELNEEVKLFLFGMMRAYSVDSAEQLILRHCRFHTNNKIFAKIPIGRLEKAFSQMQTIAANARKFGVVSNIIVLPLLINQRDSTGFMFKVTYGHKIIASGGRFDSLIKRPIRTKRTRSLNVSAVEVSFNVENILELLCSRHESCRSADVVIVAKDKTIAISLYTALLSKEIKCEIVNQLISSDETTQRPLIVIQQNDEYHNSTLYRVEATGIPWNLVEVFRGSWNDSRFFKILSDELAPRRLPQIPFAQPQPQSMVIPALQDFLVL